MYACICVRVLCVFVNMCESYMCLWVCESVLKVCKFVFVNVCEKMCESLVIIAACNPPSYLLFYLLCLTAIRENTTF